MKYSALFATKFFSAVLSCLVLLPIVSGGAQACVTTSTTTHNESPQKIAANVSPRDSASQSNETAAMQKSFTDSGHAECFNDTLDNPCNWPKRFSKKTDALAKVKLLSAEGIEATLSMQSMSVRKGYQIKSPVFESITQANEYIEKLEAVGMDDYYLPTFPGAAMQAALGSFYSGEKALSRLNHVLSAGLLADITPWMIDVPAFTVSPIIHGSDTALVCDHN
ncbi:MAG: hypothetical protein KTR32_30695 [Granulosicoccus sp.]|nr:hypothetical protein [Granulosicoccus sp.]